MRSVVGGGVRLFRCTCVYMCFLHKIAGGVLVGFWSNWIARARRTPLLLTCHYRKLRVHPHRTLTICTSKTKTRVHTGYEGLIPASQYENFWVGCKQTQLSSINNWPAESEHVSQDCAWQHVDKIYNYNNMPNQYLTEWPRHRRCETEPVCCHLQCSVPSEPSPAHQMLSKI